ncbi:hypothetical protein F5Y18DRAFT_421209 [Xylariaceae sp. FL1019]|nr:hypothetical protein F5Y18DRAFT_421209 [Xylariaceae sp. FL1019]
MPGSRSKIANKPSDHIEFFGSQVGGKSVINYSYTDPPWKLVLWDTKYFFYFIWALPYVLWPVRPCLGGHFDELSFSRGNAFCIVIHAILVILQLAFIIALPIALVLPAYLFGAGFGVFILVNWLLCRLLNGCSIIYESDPQYAPALEDHQHEHWVFMNGVAVGEAWLKSNINRLALTFKRPVTGIHNRTTGIIFDVIECLIERNFGYATTEVRAAYKIIKEKLYNPQYDKVVLILHSQGGIEGGLVCDWLLQELPQDLLAKLEVYTFGSAANHFNNPHRHVGSQDEEQKHPGIRTEVPKTVTEVPLTDSPVDMRAPSLRSKTSRRSMASSGTSRQLTMPACDRALGHVEHYAHTTDFVALWGLLHFVTNVRASTTMPQFIGRVFSRTSSQGGHQFSQHYLNGMFPLAKGPDGEFTGCADRNDFMDSIVELGKEGTEADDAREGFENTWARLIDDGHTTGPSDVAVHGSFHGDESEFRDGRVRVKQLSRLWLYRNGRSPPDIPRGLTRGLDGVVRGVTF